MLSYNIHHRHVRVPRKRLIQIDRSSRCPEDELFEMSTLIKEKSGLPVDIYLDDNGTYLTGGHGPRIKFMKEKGGTTNSRETIPMTISEEPIIPAKCRSKNGLSKSDIDKIKEFVKLNYVNLLRLCQERTYNFDDFMLDMVKSKGEPSQRILKNENSFPKIKPAGTNLVLYIEINANDTIVYDLNPVVRDNSFFSSLKDEKVFNEVRLENGTLHWDDCSIPLKRILQDKANQYSEEEYNQILAEGLRFSCW